MSTHLPRIGHDDHSGTGSHAGSWIVTYSDMITLLMAFFIALITFASKSNTGKEHENRNALMESGSGRDLAGTQRKETIPKNAVVWRLRFRPTSASETGAEFAPLYLDPSADMSTSVLQALLTASSGKLSNCYLLRLPVDLLLGSNGKIKPSGKNMLLAIARNLREMPYDFQFQVPTREQVPEAVELCMFLSTEAGIHPGRLAAGVRQSSERELDYVWLLLTPQT